MDTDDNKPIDLEAEIKRAAREMDQSKADLALQAFYKWHEDNNYNLIKPDEQPREVKWLVNKFITTDGLVLISAKSKLGKSALLYDLAIGAATGTGAVKSVDGGWVFDFNGTARKTYYLDTENSRSLVLRRLQSLTNEKKCKPYKEILESKQLEINCLESVLPVPFLSKDGSDFEQHIEAAKAYGQMLGEAGVELIIIDIMSHCYPDDDSGKDENDRVFISKFYKIINAMKSASGAAIILVHHHRKGPSDQGNVSASGSGQLLRTPTTLISLSKLPKADSPDGDLLELLVEGRETYGARKFLKARSAQDGKCRVFDEVPEPVKEKKPRGAPATASKTAQEILEAVLLKAPECKEETITPARWIRLVERVNGNEPEWQLGEETLKSYLSKHLIDAGRVKKINTGVYRIL